MKYGVPPSTRFYPTQRQYSNLFKSNMFIKSLLVRILLYVAETHEKDKGDLIESIHKLMKLC